MIAQVQVRSERLTSLCVVEERLSSPSLFTIRAWHKLRPGLGVRVLIRLAVWRRSDHLDLRSVSVISLMDLVQQILVLTGDCGAVPAQVSVASGTLVASPDRWL